MPTNLKEDIWVRGIELKPTNRRVVHHIISDLVEDDGKADDPKPKLARDPSRKDIGGVGGLVPGRLYQVMEEGVARKIPAGADIVLQMHYTTIGRGVTDQTEIGVILAKEPPARVRAEGGGQIPNPQLVIPPNHPNFEVTAQRVIDKDTYLTNVYPHMHVRGKDVKYVLDHAGWPRGNRALGAALRLQLADQLSPCRAEVHAEGIDPEGRRPLRQLAREPLQPRSVAGSALGRSDLGRDADRLLQHRRRAGAAREHQSSSRISSLASLARGKFGIGNYEFGIRNSQFLTFTNSKSLIPNS